MAYRSKIFHPPQKMLLEEFMYGFQLANISIVTDILAEKVITRVAAGVLQVWWWNVRIYPRRPI